MSNTTLSPNMSLPVPTVSVDPGPDWATNINASLSVLDQHNHSAGSGVQVTPAGININSDLTFASNNATNLRSARFSSQSAVLTLGTDLDCTYVVNGDLYFNDGSGNKVRITQSGSVTGSTGTITGLPSGTASASFSSTTFNFQSATNTPASISGGPITIGQAVASGFGVTVSASGSQSANYGLTLPVSLPGSTSVATIDASGNIATTATTGTGLFVRQSAATIVAATISGGSLIEGSSLNANTIDQTTIGAITPSTGTFTTLVANGVTALGGGGTGSQNFKVALFTGSLGSGSNTSLSPSGATKIISYSGITTFSGGTNTEMILDTSVSTGSRIVFQSSTSATSVTIANPGGPTNTYNVIVFYQ